LIGELTVEKFLFYVNVPGIKMMLYVVASIFMISLIIHRLLACIIGITLRAYFRKSLKNTGKYDIHFGWISYRGVFDLNQLVVRDITWRNPPEFSRTPFLLHCKAIAVSFSPVDFFNLIVGSSNRIAFDEITIDSLEIYFERGE
jgi:hypothetical protein